MDDPQPTQDIDFLKHFSKLRVSQKKVIFTSMDIKHLLTGYCVFDSDRIRYRCLTKKKVAVIGVICYIGDNLILLSSLTRSKMVVNTDLASSYKVGQVVLIQDPKANCTQGKWKLQATNESKITVLGKSVDFGFCSYEDPKSRSCMEVVNKSVGSMCEKHAKKEFEVLSKAIARRQELGGASIYNELRFNYKSRYQNNGLADQSSEKCPRKRTLPFYDEPGFEQEVDEMPEGKEKMHLQTLLKRLKPKRMKSMQEQMQEHLQKKQDEPTLSSEEEKNQLLEQYLTPQKPAKKASNYILLESVEPRPSATEIENLIFSLKKTTTRELSSVHELTTSSDNISAHTDCIANSNLEKGIPKDVLEIDDSSHEDLFF